MNVYFFFISLVSDFLAVRFSVSSGCSRRRSVSTYAAILVLPSPLSNDGELRIGGLNSYLGEFLVVLEGPTSRK